MKEVIVTYQGETTIYQSIEKAAVAVGVSHSSMLAHIRSGKPFRNGAEASLSQRLYSAEKAAAKLGVSVNRIRIWLRKEGIPCQDTRYPRFSDEDIEAIRNMDGLSRARKMQAGSGQRKPVLVIWPEEVREFPSSHAAASVLGISDATLRAHIASGDALQCGACVDYVIETEERERI